VASCLECWIETSQNTRYVHVFGWIEFLGDVYQYDMYQYDVYPRHLFEVTLDFVRVINLQHYINV